MASSLRSYLFTSATVRIGVPIAQKYGTVSMEPTRYVKLHFRDQRGAASLRHRHRAEITSLCVNRSPRSGMIFVPAKKLSSIVRTEPTL